MSPIETRNILVIDMSDSLNYTVGWNCAATTKYVAAQAFRDEKHKGPKYVTPLNNNDYTLRRVGKHNIVVAVLPNKQYGISFTTGVVKDMLHSFLSVRIGRMVSIGGGAPSKKHDTYLGDVMISAPRDGKGIVF
jgi:hypothetical protein